MSDSSPIRSTHLSQLLGAQAGEATSRRTFLERASALSLVIGGSALAGCRPNETKDADSGLVSERARGGDNLQLQNPNSKLDTALHKGTPPRVSSTTTDMVPGFHRYDAALPPLTDERRRQIHWRAREVPLRISQDTTVAAWTFEGDVPGPIVHCRVGDTVEFTLTNEGMMPHSMDFHAAQIDPKLAFRSVAKGQSVSFTFKPKWAGAFMYHCGTAPVLMHIGSGMFGAIIVSPERALRAAKEFVLVQSEFYLAAANANGIRAFDYDKMLATQPDFVTFNGRPLQYVNEPIRVSVGDRVRFWLVNCGPTHPCSFHVVGEQFDTVYLGAPPGTPLRGVQTWDVCAGGGMCFELDCDIPGEFPFVNHGFGHGQKGAIGFLVVEDF